MFKSLYTRILITNFIVVLVSLLMLGVLVATVFRNQFVDSREAEMRADCQEINKIVGERYFLLGERMSLGHRSAAIEEMQKIAGKYNASIWIVGKNGERLWVESSQSSGSWSSTESTVPVDDMLQMALEGWEYLTYDFFGEKTDELIMTLGRPLEVNESVQGAIFMHARLDDMQKQINEIYYNILLASLAALAMAAFLVPVTSRRFTKPLLETNSIVKSLAKGDFSRRLRVKSEDEMGELARNINSMADDLQALEDMRREFVANVSHELRSPLTSIHGFIEASMECSKEERSEYLSIALDETRRMNVLINDLLDLAKIESGTIPLNISSFDINEQIRRILIAFEGKIDDKGVGVEADFENDSCMVDADPDRISQVIRNLVDNAIKFTPSGGMLTLRTKAVKGRAEIEVGDNGAGISEQDLEQIWERFYKVDKAHTRTAAGTGLGLSIVRKLIEQHGSVITAKSRLGEGTSFMFSLPLSKIKREKHSNK